MMLRSWTPLAAPLCRDCRSPTGTRRDGPPISDHRDVAVVRADDPARRRPLALVQHADERLAGVGLAVDAEELGRRECRGEGHGGGGEKPAVERDEVGREATRRGAPASAPSSCSISGVWRWPRDPVRLHVLVRFGVEVHRLDLPALRPGAGQAGLAIDHDAVEAREPALEAGAPSRGSRRPGSTRRRHERRADDRFRWSSGRP